MPLEDNCHLVFKDDLPCTALSQPGNQRPAFEFVDDNSFDTIPGENLLPARSHGNHVHVVLPHLARNQMRWDVTNTGRFGGPAHTRKSPHS